MAQFKNMLELSAGIRYVVTKFGNPSSSGLRDLGVHTNRQSEIRYLAGLDMPSPFSYGIIPISHLSKNRNVIKYTEISYHSI